MVDAVKCKALSCGSTQSHADFGFNVSRNTDTHAAVHSVQAAACCGSTVLLPNMPYYRTTKGSILYVPSVLACLDQWVAPQAPGVCHSSAARGLPDAGTQ